MKPPTVTPETLLRYLDGRLAADEVAHVEACLRTDPAARAFLREVAEQAVLVADLERMTAARESPLRGVARPALPSRSVLHFPAWGWGLAAAAVFVLVAGWVAFAPPGFHRARVQVLRATGSSHYFGASDPRGGALGVGTSLGAGDALETQSCDAWIEMRLPDHATLTMAGNSSLRVLGAEPNAQFQLLEGTLWVSPAPRPDRTSLVVQTPTATVVAQAAQFDLQTSSTDSILRVNQGEALVTPLPQGTPVRVQAGQQVSVSLGHPGRLKLQSQPRPTDRWACELAEVPDVLLGRRNPGQGNDEPGVAAEPLLWPVSDRDTLLLHAVAVAAWRTTDQPVVLRADSRLRFRGRTSRPQTVRFGFSTQKVRGVFAGKFEVDVPPSRLRPVGSTWAVELPLRDFQPLSPQLNASPEGLELTDLYALTVQVDAGLELISIELQPPVP
jgi:ferric-dicitrate binding protein FerR (iron transport regulator)